MKHDHSAHPSDSYFAGIDGGGSKTLAVIVDAQGRERGRALAGSGSHTVVGLEQAASQLRVAVEKAAQVAGCSLPLCVAWFGVAGIDSLHDHDQLFPHLSSLAQAVLLTNDAELVLGALDNRVGVALIAGTGTIGLGRNGEGAFARASGWGHLLNEEGSGYELGRQALVAAVRAADGRGPQTLLLDSILECWHLHDPGGILAQIYPATDKAKIARLSALVFAAARAGDAVASHMVQRAVHELALVVTTVSNKLHFSDQPLPLALGGSLLVHEADYREQVLHHLRTHRSLGQLAIVDQPALIAARAAIQLAQ
jgi:glucosamine kinase